MLTVRNTRPITASVLAGVVAALGTACSSSAGSGAASASSAATHQAAASASTSAPSPTAEALAAYRAMWQEVTEASKTADYQASYLSDHLGGAAFQTVTGNLKLEKKAGEIALGTPVLHPVVVSAASASVALSDCLDDRAWLNYTDTTPPKLVDNVPGGFRSTTATVTDEGGTWKVTEINSGADGTCHLSQGTG
jgi:hypothetical protein